MLSETIEKDREKAFHLNKGIDKPGHTAIITRISYFDFETVCGSLTAS